MNTNYISPSIEVIEVELEGILCASGFISSGTSLEAFEEGGILGDTF